MRWTRLARLKIRMLIGISAEEAARRINPNDDVPLWLSRNIEWRYPLVETGWNRADCQRYIKESGHPFIWPSLCRWCSFKDEKLLLYQYRFEREDFDLWVRMEQAKRDASAERFPDPPHHKNHGVWPGRTLPEVLEGAFTKYGHLTDDELTEHRRTHGHSVASRY